MVYITEAPIRGGLDEQPTGDSLIVRAPCLVVCEVAWGFLFGQSVRRQRVRFSVLVGSYGLGAIRFRFDRRLDAGFCVWIGASPSELPD